MLLFATSFLLGALFLPSNGSQDWQHSTRGQEPDYAQIPWDASRHEEATRIVKAEYFHWKGLISTFSKNAMSTGWDWKESLTIRWYSHACAVDSAAPLTRCKQGLKLLLNTLGMLATRMLPLISVYGWLCQLSRMQALKSFKPQMTLSHSLATFVCYLNRYWRLGIMLHMLMRVMELRGFLSCG